MNLTSSLPSPPALRLRRFLHERGLRLKPWATQEQILETFLAHLAHDRHEDDYWDELTKLAGDLAEELRQRRPGSALAEAIVVDTKALMQELRSALAKSRSERQGYRTLNTMLTGPAMTLLLLVTFVGVGCGGDTGGSDRNGATTPPTGGAGAGGATTTLAMGGAGGSSSGTGGISLIEIPNGGATTGFGDDGPELASGAPSWGAAGGAGGAGGAVGAGAGGEPGCIPSEMTFREMVEACIEDSEAREAYLAALESSHPDWSNVLRDYFRCRTCGEVLDHIGQCYSGSRQMGDVNPPEGSDSIYDFCPPVMVYIGVRFA